MMQTWTEQEIDFLQKNYMTMSDIEIAKALGRSRGSVTKYRLKLDLSRKPQKTRKVRFLIDPASDQARIDVNKKLILDWYRAHGEQSYSDAPVDYRDIVSFYQRAA
jgi:hypothetical protein